MPERMASRALPPPTPTTTSSSFTTTSSTAQAALSNVVVAEEVGISLCLKGRSWGAAPEAAAAAEAAAASSCRVSWTCLCKGMETSSRLLCQAPHMRTRASSQAGMHKHKTSRPIQFVEA